MTLLIGPPRRGRTHEVDEDLPDAETDHGAAEVTILDEERDHRERDPAERLREDAAAVRLHVSWPGLRRTLSPEQKYEAASPFDADSGSLSASKKLLDTNHPALRAAAKVRHAAVSYWKTTSLPFPENGVRLLPRDDLPSFERRMNEFQRELAETAIEVDRSRDDLVDLARQRLGDLFDPSDYPRSLAPLFGLSWDLPAVEPPDYLRRLSPRLYQQECDRVRQRFEQAVELAEQAFAQELAQLVDHLRERLTGGENGGPRVFRDSAIENLTEFFQRFRRLNVNSSPDLDAVVAEAEGLMRGVDPVDLRANTGVGWLQQRVREGLTGVAEALDPLVADAPRRRVLRSPRGACFAKHRSCSSAPTGTPAGCTANSSTPPRWVRAP
ncbi:hypothetical protein [Alienimonas californiensis]|uniref:Uncharacterized protein n=1 Tax=Alienimonas californiensis TaxID=2527989 RepID=A0A517PBP6_9PLAN|nr:hypothetical protein [Alienimonas californiensis]QDT16776.1 hypothetical protein CA12_28830 [Alienimonas californiensis]